MLYNIPIESLEERYSMQWNSWIPEAFKVCGVPFTTIYPATLTNKIENGAFLDVCGTNFFKAGQLQIISELFYHNKIKDGDIFFLNDLWYPGLEMLAYMKDGLGIDIKIYGIMHAGTYDHHDFLFRQGMHYWAHKIEEGWFRIVDGIFVATEFHRNLILKHRKVRREKIHVTGLPIFRYDLPFKSLPKENIVLFPHRLDPEKKPEMFDKLSQCFPEDTSWKFYRTKDVCENKQQYYDWLSKAKIAVSFAEQETWGIAMQEAVFAGCVPLVPNRLSYQELYPNVFRFDDIPSNITPAVETLKEMMENWDRYSNYTEILASTFDCQGTSAIPNMLRTMRLI